MTRPSLPPLSLGAAAAPRPTAEGRLLAGSACHPAVTSPRPASSSSVRPGGSQGTSHPSFPGRRPSCLSQAQNGTGVRVNGALDRGPASGAGTGPQRRSCSRTRPPGVATRPPPRPRPCRPESGRGLTLHCGDPDGGERSPASQGNHGPASPPAGHRHRRSSQTGPELGRFNPQARRCGRAPGAGGLRGLGGPPRRPRAERGLAAVCLHRLQSV